jgi:hypothetical protein
VVTAYPAVLLRRAVSFSSRSVGCKSFGGFLEGICLCSESTCIVNGMEMAQSGRYDTSTLRSNLKGMVVDVLVYIKCREDVK